MCREGIFLYTPQEARTPAFDISNAGVLFCYILSAIFFLLYSSSNNDFFESAWASLKGVA